MIFATFGVQLEFDRLVVSVLRMAQEDPSESFVIQGSYSFDQSLPENVQFVGKLTESQFEQYVLLAEIVISHAGMGTLITCLKHRRKVIMVPRDAAKKEHRNNHQMDTLHSFQSLSGVYPCYNTEDLRSDLELARMDSPPMQFQVGDEPKKLAAFLQHTLFTG
ncbi:glycosyltransferase [Aliiglaciecola sp. LCG003]|uniref:glycosyltransferase n=1 Tax=Aliiglaciecola sp. LCG003 TaxID=3053655 RepID=UPI002573A1CE|nr:glycosyltransferase [Aliiglaciecola sp. LCG003]WJG09741.1 glycosyltransferase [Aliiglaciecola sp. LCG003]